MSRGRWGWPQLAATVILSLALALTAAFTIRDSHTEIRDVTGISGAVQP